jgi:hypothetical protein
MRTAQDCEQGLNTAVNRAVNTLAARVAAARTLPRRRLVPRLVWAWLRWRWPRRKASVQLFERADGTVEVVRKPLRVWWPWSWVLASERWLAAPGLCGLAVWAARGWPWPLLALGAVAVAGRSWWVCQCHVVTVGGWHVRTLWAALAALGLALAWLWLAPGGTAGLACGTLAVALARLWHLRHGHAADVRRVARVWAIRLGAEGARLPGSVVEDARVGSGGSLDLHVVLPPGRLALADLERARGHIATAYGTVSAQVRVTRGDDDARPVVHVAPPGVLARVAPWPGDAVRADGTVHVGTLADEQPAVVRLWSEVGSKVVWLVGKRGSGKSRAVHLLLASCARSGLVALDLVDMKGGVDLTRWAPHTVTGSVACDLDGAREALRRANRVHDLRMTALRGSGAEKHRVGPDGPLWLTVLEEAPEALSDPECARLAGRLARLSRATGVGMLIVSQVAKVEAVGGRDVAQNVDLRAVFECDRDTARRAADGRSDVDLSAMPVGRPGVALWLGEGADDGQLGRWFDLDPAEAVQGALAPSLDPSALDALRPEADVPEDVPVILAPVPEVPRRTLVAAYVGEHPGASSAEIASATGVPAGTVRRWRTQGRDEG